MRRGGVIAGLLALAAVLGGCSASADSSTADGRAYDDAAYAEAGSEAMPESGDFEQAAATDRALVITGDLYITVEDPLAAADEAARLVQSAGGRVDARSEQAAEGSSGGYARLTLRIPADELDATVDRLRGLGEVDQYSTNSYDVTVEVADLAAEISTLRASTLRIEGLLADAESIADIITLENELASRQAELQSLEAQQRGLDDQVSMSTIDLSLTTEPVVIVIEDTSPHNFWDGLALGWKGVVSFVSVALVVIGVLLPWALPLGLLAFGLVWLARRNRARRPARQPAPVPMPQQGLQAPVPQPQPTPVPQPAPASAQASGPEDDKAAPPRP